MSQRSSVPTRGYGSAPAALATAATRPVASPRSRCCARGTAIHGRSLRLEEAAAARPRAARLARRRRLPPRLGWAVDPRTLALLPPAPPERHDRGSSLRRRWRSTRNRRRARRRLDGAGAVPASALQSLLRARVGRAPRALPRLARARLRGPGGELAT